MCNTARPRNARSALLVDKNSTHPAAVAARRGGGRRAANSAAGALRAPPQAVATRESPPRGAKDRASQKITAQLVRPPPVPVAEVVRQPAESSPDSPLVPPPAAASAGVGLGGEATSSDDDDDHARSLFDYDDGEYADPEVDSPTDGEVSKYSFFQRLTHYMDGATINQQNRKAIEIAILVEAFTKVRDMDPMKKATREDILLRKYTGIISEIEDNCFEDPTVRESMLSGYKGAKREGLKGSNLLRKIDIEMTNVRKFSVKFPGFNNPAGLPSGLTQLRDMKATVVAKLWKSKYPVMCC